MRALVSRVPLPTRIGLGFLAVLVLVAVFAPWLAPYPPDAVRVGPSVAPPSLAHLFGTDLFGRDVLSRVIFGARISMAVGLIATALVFVVGSVIGAYAAVAPRVVSETIMRAIDVILAFPVLMLAVALAAILSRGLQTVIIIVVIRYAPELARVVFANVRAQLGESYVDAERVQGASLLRVLVGHVAPNCLVPVLVFAALIMADAIVLEAALSFVGLGIAPPTPSWGNVIADGRELIFAGGWYVMFFPGMAIFAAVLALNICAEGVADAFGRAEAPRRARRETRLGATAVTIADRPLAAAPVDAILVVEHLGVRFPRKYGDVDVLSDVSLHLRASEVLGIVGESGCGKSLLALAIMGLLPKGAELTGSIRLRGRELTTLDARARRALMGREIGMAYQDATSSLNPGMTVRAAIAQLRRYGARYAPAELLQLVGLPERLLNRYPYQLSGGQRQRVLIALALARGCSLLIADEPTTALDVTTQAEIVELLKRLRAELGLCVLLISHDVPLVATFADRMAVLYAGQLVERGALLPIVDAPRHPYTYGLVASVASLERCDATLVQIVGTVPSPSAFGSACRFAPRCARAQVVCTQSQPLERETDAGRLVACNFPMERAG